MVGLIVHLPHWQLVRQHREKRSPIHRPRPCTPLPGSLFPSVHNLDRLPTQLEPGFPLSRPLVRHPMARFSLRPSQAEHSTQPKYRAHAQKGVERVRLYAITQREMKSMIEGEEEDRRCSYVNGVRNENGSGGSKPIREGNGRKRHSPFPPSPVLGP